MEYTTSSYTDITVARLANLFRVDPQVVKYIVNKAVISGGALLYALNESIDPSTVYDMDIYINNKDAFRDIAIYLLKKTDGTAYMVDNRYGLSVNRKSSIVEIRSDNRRPFQLIYFQFNNPIDILNNVDMDCNQCALHYYGLTRSNWCIESHLTGTVRYISKMLSHRIEKTLAKGFTLVPALQFIDPDYIDNRFDNSTEINLDEFELGHIIVPEPVYVWWDTAI